MTLEQLINYLDAGVSIGILLWIVYRMEKGHSAAVARLWAYIEKLSNDRDDEPTRPL